MLSARDIDRFRRDGFFVLRGALTEPEAAGLRDHYMRVRAAGTYPLDDVDVDLRAGDPLRRHPRLMQMHRWDELSRRRLLDARVFDAVAALLGSEPLAVQTMVYFKPPGARGQALHQDQYFVRARPGTCMAAWLALDDCDERNGCLHVVPGSQEWPILCPTRADAAESFVSDTVPLPDGVRSEPVIMRAGDLLLFNGSLVHGSFPNTTADRFRRALICHYIDARASVVASFYQPALRRDGTETVLRLDHAGGPCGVWVDRDGEEILQADGGRLPGWDSGEVTLQING